MRISYIAAVVFAGAVTASAMVDSFAQFGGGMPGGGMRGNRNRPDSTTRESRPPVQDNSPEQIEDRMGLLEEDLHLAANQRAAWQACEQKVLAYAGDLGRERTRDTAGPATLSSLQQIDYAIDIARNRLTALEDIAAATRTLYATLTAEQKSVVDPRLANIITSIASPARGGPSRQKGPL